MSSYVKIKEKRWCFFHLDKFYIFGSIGVIGGAISSFIGGVDEPLVALLLFMLADYITGMIVGGVFKNSAKTEDGGLESRAGWKGLVRKFSTLILVVVAARLDIILDTDYIRSMVVFAFLANELLSIIENVGLMGVKIPKVLSNAISVLNRRGDIEDETKKETM